MDRRDFLKAVPLAGAAVVGSSTISARRLIDVVADSALESARQKAFTSEHIMVQSLLTVAGKTYTLDIKHAAYREGTVIQPYPPKDGKGRTAIGANQSWTVKSDPLGSSHYIIVNPTSGKCIGIGANVASGANAVDDATDPYTGLTLQKLEPANNHYQLWNFIRPTDGTGHDVFIQNPTTGLVLEFLPAGPAFGFPHLLCVSPRDISNPRGQLWKAVNRALTNVTRTAFPIVKMAKFGAPLRGNTQYVLLPPNQRDHFTGITVTLDFLSDTVVGGCSVQVNCNTPYLGRDGTDTEDYDRDAQWMQFMIFMQNNQLSLANQFWHRSGPVLASEFPSETEISPAFLTLTNNTIPSGTRIILNICMDANDFAIGMTALALSNFGGGLPIGDPVFWPAPGRDTFHTTVDGGKVHERAMAPIGAFQVVFCSLPGASGAVFSSGQGTITTTASPGIIAGDSAPNPFGLGTAESSNIRYDLLPSGTYHLIAQPFGV